MCRAGERWSRDGGDDGCRWRLEYLKEVVRSGEGEGEGEGEGDCVCEGGRLFQIISLSDRCYSIYFGLQGDYGKDAGSGRSSA